MVAALRVTTELLELLDREALGIEATEQSDGRYSLAMRQEAIEDLAVRFKFDWTLAGATR